MHRKSTSTQGNGTNELWYTTPYHLQPKYQDHVHRILVHPKKEDKERGEKATQKNKREQDEEKWNKKTNMRWGRRPSRGENLVFAATILRIWHVQLMDQQKDDTKIRKYIIIYFIFLNPPADGWHEMTGRKTRQQDTARKTKPAVPSHVQLVGQGRHKRPKRGQRRRAKVNNTS